MKKYLIILLVMVICCENRLHAMDRSQPLMMHRLLVFELREISEHAMKLRREAAIKQLHTSMLEHLSQELEKLKQRKEQKLQRRRQQQQIEEQWRQEQRQRQEQREEQEQQQQNMLEIRVKKQAIKHQKKIYSKHHCAQIRSNQRNACVHQPQSTKYAAKNKRQK